MMAEIVQLDAKARPSPFGWLSWGDLTAGPLPEVPWAVPILELGPGRPCGLWGYAGSGKTWIAQAIALAVASGEKLFGSIEVAHGKVAHVSHELGRRALQERYRRLANGHMIDPTELEGMLRVSAYPRVYLNSHGAEQVYTRELEGHSLCIIDSLRRALPGEDENASTISNFLDVLSHVSDKTGCTILLLHHEGKSAVNGAPGKKDGEKRGTGRGSSAIEDASGCVLRVEGGGKGPRCIKQARAHDDGEGEVAEVWIDLQPIAIPEPIYQAGKPPLRCVLLGADDIADRERAGRRKLNRAAAERRAADVVAAIEAGSTTVRKVRADCGDSRAVRDTIDELVEAGVLTQAKGINGTASILKLGATTLEDYLHPPTEDPSKWDDYLTD